MKNSYIYLIAGSALALLLLNSKKAQGTGAMTDSPVSLDNIRKGVARGWYQAELTMVDGQRAVRLSGKQTDGTYTTDVYPVTDEVWNALLQDGIQIV